MNAARGARAATIQDRRKARRVRVYEAALVARAVGLAVLIGLLCGLVAVLIVLVLQEVVS